jgi:hypothetical protein
VIEETNDDLRDQDEFGGEYLPEDPNYQQEFAEDADGGKSSLFPLMHIDLFFKHNPWKPF